MTFTKIYYKGTEAIGFDFASTKPVLAVYIKASTGTPPSSTTTTTVAAPVDPTLYSISGFVFHDLNNNGVKDSGETGIDGVPLNLGNGVNATSDSNGAYSFANLAAGSYTVTSMGKDNFWATPYDVPVTAKAATLPESATGVNFGLSYESVSGFTFKDSNADGIMNKAIANKTAGTQVSKANLLAYVNQLSTFALYPLNVLSMQEASNYLSATGSSSTLLLSKQLMGSEFNYASGAYIGGNALAAQFFLYNGEYMLANPGSFSSAQLLAQKDK